MGEKRYAIRSSAEMYSYLRGRVRDYGTSGEVLEGISSATAFQLGAETVLHEMFEAIGDDPREFGIITVRGN